MNISKISVRYAKALLSLALEENNSQKINEDIKLVFEVSSLHEMALMLENPVVSSNSKISVMKALFESKIDPVTLKFLILLIKNKRESHLKNISRTFLGLYRDHYGIKSVSMTTAVEIDESFRKQVFALISDSFGSKLELDYKVDSAILGGFVLKIGDNQYDASIASGLKKIKRELSEIPIN